MPDHIHRHIDRGTGAGTDAKTAKNRGWNSLTQKEPFFLAPRKKRVSASKILPGTPAPTGNYFIKYRLCEKNVRLHAVILPQVFYLTKSP
ncbi:hypothetical protein CFBP6624_09725 [Agrobacterium tumefaciens]|uniref:Uncharacterized protein n=1 Tax=Agrobacterium tumefaciens TaxID=358 RepID=A0AAE6BMV5_AGRTU|nr:hypothetical protein CFBP6624_09725 [Agrobacterium tumefaciens]